MSENQRLAELQKILGFRSQAEFAAALGIKQGSLSDIYRGKNGIGVSAAIKSRLFKDYSINIDWVETGAGSMYVENSGTQKNVNGNNIQADDLLYNYPPDRFCLPQHGHKTFPPRISEAF